LKRDVDEADEALRSLVVTARILGSDSELLEAIVYNDDNLSYGAIISVYTDSDETITALTDDGIDELNHRNLARVPRRLCR